MGGSFRWSSLLVPPAVMSADDSTAPIPSAPTLWRRVAASSWAEPSSPVVYARVQVDVTEAEKQLKELSASTGKKVTLTSLVSWALAKAIGENPDCNQIVRAGELKQLPSVDVNIAVALPDSDTVWPCKVAGADKLTLLEVADKIKRDKDVIHSKQAAAVDKYGMMDWLMPASVVRFVFNTFTALETDWGLNLSRVGVNNVAYQPASATITCNHRFGLEESFATFPANQPTPMIISIGLVTEKPWVVKGQVVPRRLMTLCFTVDHRVMDGKLGGRLMRATKKYIERFMANPRSTCTASSSSKVPQAKL